MISGDTHKPIQIGPYYWIERDLLQKGKPVRNQYSSMNKYLLEGSQYRAQSIVKIVPLFINTLLCMSSEVSALPLNSPQNPCNAHIVWIATNYPPF